MNVMTKFLHYFSKIEQYISTKYLQTCYKNANLKILKISYFLLSTSPPPPFFSLSANQFSFLF